ncbi:polysaccharide deacetylase [Chelatococcus reniformis]|uniref:Chitooligosaccharide deacetylase n=1 Tax=Chelatococcus reniformis TaxID=1494448 RepID=A0A916XMC5_9HYPH|nr:polysaccharide deacetylase [Chelatococcus reniformis]
MPAALGKLEAPPLRLSDVAGKPKRVALTLDACRGQFDLRIANVLVAEKVPTTIFATALWIRSNPRGLQLLLDHPELFVIENHGEHHHAPILKPGEVYGVPTVATPVGLKAEVENGAAAVRQATGRQPVWYRGATALYSPDAITAISKMGFAVAGFSINGDQGASLPAPSVARNLRGAQARDVIIGHINKPDHTAGLGIVEGIRALRQGGTEFVHLDNPDTSVR